MKPAMFVIFLKHPNKKRANVYRNISGNYSEEQYFASNKTKKQKLFCVSNIDFFCCLFSYANSNLFFAYIAFVSGLPFDLSLFWYQYPFSLGLGFCKLRALISEA